MLKVHFVAGTRAGRVVWLLEELGLEYEVNIMPFTKEGLKSPEHRSRHALRQSASIRRWGYFNF